LHSTAQHRFEARAQHTSARNQLRHRPHPATARAAGQKVSFFMRKGADLLSKWVGEAERQLRLLFEEAARQQPAIIFFDEARDAMWRCVA